MLVKRNKKEPTIHKMEMTHFSVETMTLSLNSKFSKNGDRWLVNYLYACISYVFYLTLQVIKLNMEI